MRAPQPTNDEAAKKPSARDNVSRFWLTNPFFVLCATPRDPRRRIIELAEELSLEGDPATISKARADLTHPRARLTAEMAWLPGVSPKRASECINAAVLLPEHTDTFKALPSLARANLLSVAFSAIDANGGRSAPCSLESFAALISSIDASEVRRHVNEDRAIAGFPEITNVDWIEAELADRRRAYRASISSWMERSETVLMLDSLIASVESATGEGQTHPPLLIEEVVADYELSAQPALTKAADAVNKLLEHARSIATKNSAALTPTIAEIAKFTREWAYVARPQQLCAKARGEGHAPSIELASRIRSLGIALANNHDLYEAANSITWLLREVFVDVPSVTETVVADAAAVKDLLEKQKKVAADKQSFDKDITYAADIGMLFKTRLAVSPKEVQWGNLKFPLDSITRVRWGSVKHSINFIPTGTDYHVLFGDDSHFAKFSLSDKTIYDDFCNRLWRAVAHKIIFRYAQGLREGKSFAFGNILISDNGCELSRQKFFGSERVEVPWSDVHIWSSRGNLVIGVKTNKKISASSSYKDDDNTHLLDSMIRGFFKDAAAKRISDAFLN